MTATENYYQHPCDVCGHLCNWDGTGWACPDHGAYPTLVDVPRREQTAMPDATRPLPGRKLRAWAATLSLPAVVPVIVAVGAVFCVLIGWGLTVGLTVGWGGVVIAAVAFAIWGRRGGRMWWAVPAVWSGLATLTAVYILV